MNRRLRSVAIVPALLILLTSGAVQARPLHAQAPPASLWAQIRQLPIWQWTGIGTKEGEGMDPNGAKSPTLTPKGRGSHPDPMPVGR
jgi:hypothetical protein